MSALIAVNWIWYFSSIIPLPEEASHDVTRARRHLHSVLPILPTVPFNTLRLASFWLPEECTAIMPFCGRRRAVKTARVKYSDASAKRSTRPACGVWRKGGKTALIRKETVEKESQLCKGCTHDVCNSNYNCKYCLRAKKIGGVAFVPTCVEHKLTKTARNAQHVMVMQLLDWLVSRLTSLLLT